MMVQTSIAPDDPKRLNLAASGLCQTESGCGYPQGLVGNNIPLAAQFASEDLGMETEAK
jgi:hypothetical protein